MPAAITPIARAETHDFLRCNQLLTQYLDGASAWVLCGLHWSIQQFHYCCPVEADYGTQMHQHDFLEINLLCKGRVAFSTPEHQLSIGPGEVYFMPPGRTHTWKTTKAPVTIAGFHIRVNALDKSGHELLKVLNARVDAGDFSIGRNAEHAHIHQSIWKLLHQNPPSPLLSEKLRALIQLFMQELIERAVPASLFAAPAVAPTIGPDTVASSKYQQIVDFVDQHIHQPIQLEDVARHFRYSVRHVARLFHKESGVALGQYILQRKLRAAQRLLATTDYPVKTIALDLGYTDVGYFCRLFRTHMMGTPNGYRTSMLVGRTSSPTAPGGHHSFRGFFRGNGPNPSPTRLAS